MRREERKIIKRDFNPKLEFESDEFFKKVKSHKLTKALLFVGGTVAVLYVSAFILKAAAKAAESWKDLKQTVRS